MSYLLTGGKKLGQHVQRSTHYARNILTALFRDIVIKSRLVGLFLFILMYLRICER